MTLLNWLLGLLIASIFFSINFKILQSDIREKRIPNRYIVYLLYLLPFSYGYSYMNGIFDDINIALALIQMLLAFCISLAIYLFWMWWAGDAKYLLILWLYIPHIGIIWLISGIALLTLLFLIWYFLWFWLGPNLWTTEKRKELYTQLWDVKKSEFLNKNKQNSNKTILISCIKKINMFLIIFIILRLLRIHVVLILLDKYAKGEIHTSPAYLTLYWIIAIFLIVTLVWCIAPIVSRLKHITQKWTYVILCNIAWSAFIFYEYIKNPEDTLQRLSFILTIWIILYLLMKVILFAYRLVFIYQEEIYIEIKDLEKWMLIDKGALIELLDMQYYIYDNIDKEIFKTLEPQAFFWPISPKEYIHNLDNPISQHEAEELQDIYKKVNALHTKYQTPSYTPFKHIKVLNTFAFAPYLFWGFLLIVSLHSIWQQGIISSTIIHTIQRFYS